MVDIIEGKILILVIIGETRPLADMAQRLLSINMPAGYDTIHRIVTNMDEGDVMRTMNQIALLKSMMAVGQLFTLVVVMLVELTGAGSVSPLADHWIRVWPRKFLWYWRPPGALLTAIPIPDDSAVVDAGWCEEEAEERAWEEIKRRALEMRTSRMWDADGLRHLNDTSGW
jgi:hypothetical protein